MTKPRDFNSLSGVVGRAMDLITAQGVADVIRKSTSWIYKVADPDNDDANITHADTLIAIDKACWKKGLPRPFRAYYDKQFADESGLTYDLDDAVLRLSELMGKLSGSHRKARDPDGPAGTHYSACERREVDALIQEVHEKLEQFASSVHSDVEIKDYRKAS